MSGKGSAARPFSNRDEYESNFDAIFRKQEAPVVVSGFPTGGGEPIKPGDAFQFAEDPEALN